MSVDVRDGETEPDLVDGPDDTEAGPAEPRRRSRLRTTLVVLAVVAALFLAVAAVTWTRADHDEQLQAAQTRDVVLVDARRDIEVLNTLDYRDVAAGLARWRAVSTGTLATTLKGVDADTQKALADAGKVTTGTVVAAALTSLDVGAGTASGLATVEISVKDQSGQTQVKRDRFTVGLHRVDGRWLVSSLEQLPVQTS